MGSERLTRSMSLRMSNVGSTGTLLRPPLQSDRAVRRGDLEAVPEDREVVLEPSSEASSDSRWFNRVEIPVQGSHFPSSSSSSSSSSGPSNKEEPPADPSELSSFSSPSSSSSSSVSSTLFWAPSSSINSYFHRVEIPVRDWGCRAEIPVRDLRFPTSALRDLELPDLSASSSSSSSSSPSYSESSTTVSSFGTDSTTPSRASSLPPVSNHSAQDVNV